jgi:hypothetical protein
MNLNAQVGYMGLFHFSINPNGQPDGLPKWVTQSPPLNPPPIPGQTPISEESVTHEAQAVYALWYLLALLSIENTTGAVGLTEGRRWEKNRT